jgi:hypothetical protein
MTNMPHKNKGLYSATPGYGTWRWLSGIAAKQASWLLGSLEGRGGYEAWMVHLLDGLQDTQFLAEFDKTSDPWQKSRMIGEKISALAKQYAELSRDEKAELAKKAEVEFKTGIEVLSREKKRVLELLKIVTDPLDD